MRFRKFALLTAVLLLGASLLTFGDDAQPELKGSVSDDHGKLSWSSSATASGSNAWEYRHIVANKDPKRNCRVNWEPIDFISTLFAGQDPSEQKRTELIRPVKKPGEIRYDGGPTDGEGASQSPAYVPDSATAEKNYSIETFAQVTIDIKGTLYPLDIVGGSESKAATGNGEREVLYYVRLKASKLNATPPEGVRVSTDVRSLLEAVRVEWESVATLPWDRITPDDFTMGWVTDEKSLKFDRQETENVYGFKVKARLPLDGKGVELRRGTIRFHDLGLSGKEAIVGQASLPAFAPHGAL